jgi:hypothetical protein
MVQEEKAETAGLLFGCPVRGCHGGLLVELQYCAALCTLTYRLCGCRLAVVRVGVQQSKTCVLAMPTGAANAASAVTLQQLQDCCWMQPVAR